MSTVILEENVNAKSVAEFLAANKLNFSDAGGVFNLRFAAASVLVDISIFTGSGYISFHARLPNIVSQEKHADVLVLLNAISRTLAVGSFEIQKGLSVVDFKTGFTALNTTVSSELLKQSFDCCIFHVNVCYGVISELVSGGISLEEAITWSDADWNKKPPLKFDKQIQMFAQ